MINSYSAGIKLNQARWFILIIFPIAFFTSQSCIDDNVSALYFLISMASCAWLLYRVDSLNPELIAIWLVVCVFILFYFLRYPVLVCNPAVLTGFYQPSVMNFFLYNDHLTLIYALKLSCFVFATFCVLSGFLLDKNSYNSGKKNNYIFHSKGHIILYLAAVVSFLMLSLGYISYIYKIGQMGVPQGEALPFRLKGIVFYGRHVVVPLLILAIIYKANLLHHHKVLYFGLLLLAIHAVSDSLLRGSRSSILLSVMLVGFLSASGGIKIRRIGMLILITITFGAILLAPAILDYRYIAFHSQSGVWEIFTYAFNSYKRDLLNLYINCIYFIYFRIPGIETIWSISSLAEPLGSKFFEVIHNQNGVTGYLNTYVYQEPIDSLGLFAPGFVGWLYLVAGWGGLLAGGIILAVMCVWAPRFFYRNYFRYSPLFNTFFLWLLFISLTDGTLDSNLLLVTVGIFTIASLETYDRIIDSLAT